MFMQKIEMAAVTCDLFSATKGFEGSGCGSIAPRAANENEARAYADFIRRKIGAPDLGKPRLQHKGGTGRLATSHFHYVGATYGEEISRGEYEPGAFSVLFPGANQMRAKVTLETLDDAGNVTGSLTMPVDPKKGGVVWSKDDVRKACGPIAKVKTPRAPTVAKRRAAPTVSQDKRRRAIMLALNLRKQLRREREISADRLRQIFGQASLRPNARQMREDCAAPVSAPDAPATAPDAILSDLAAAEGLMRCEGYVAAAPTVDEDRIHAPRYEGRIIRAINGGTVAEGGGFDPARPRRLDFYTLPCAWVEPEPEATPTSGQAKRTPAHERAIRRAWAERKAARAAKAGRDCIETTARTYAQSMERREQALRDQVKLAEQIAEDHLRMREDLQRLLRATEARLAAAEAENAQLWAEIEGLTAPQPALAA